MAGHTGLGALNGEAGAEVSGGEGITGEGLRRRPPRPVTFLTSCKRDRHLWTCRDLSYWPREREVSTETSLLNHKHLVNRDSPQSKGS